MRVSTDPSDPGYKNYSEAAQEGRTFVIEVDGRRVDEVLSADEADGVVMVFVADQRGYLITEGDQAMVRPVRGRVRITRRFKTFI